MSSGVGMVLNEVHAPVILTFASVASNGAAARMGQFGPFPRDIRVKNVWFSPTGGDQSTATGATASYRRLTLRNGGSTGTATAIVASLNLSASIASLSARAWTVDSTATVASGGILWFSHATVGGDLDDGSILRAGQFALSYETI